MAHYVFVAAQDDNKIGVYTMDADTGALTHQSDVAMPGGPSLLAISPDKQTLYVSHREALELSSHRIDPASGGLTRTGSVAVDDWPAYIATDRTGRHLLVAFYGGGPRRCVSHRGRWRAWRPALRVPGHRRWGPLHPN